MDDFDLGPEPRAGVRQAEPLARKVELLLDTILAENGKPVDYPAVCDASQAARMYISREHWDPLNADREQSLPEQLLRALASVFGVNPEFLLQEEGPLSEHVEAELILLRSMRGAGVRNFRVCPGGQVDAATLRGIARLLDDLARASTGLH